jgi:hypothetical protein
MKERMRLLSQQDVHSDITVLIRAANSVATFSCSESKGRFSSIG